MGYELHITRAESYWNSRDNPIAADEWLKIIEADPELRLAGYNGPYFAIWSGPSEYPDAWLDWREGRISSKNPDETLIEKMAQIAGKLDARVLGDDEESYVGNDGLNRLQWSLQALAQPGDEQLRLLAGCNSIAGKLWLDLERSSDFFDTEGRGPANMPEDGAEAVAEMRSRLQLMKGEGSKRIWTDAALESSREWEAVRKAARETLEIFGWKDQAPPKGWSS